MTAIGLTRRQVLALAAHDFDRKRDGEIAKEFGVSRSAIAMRRLRARRRYAKALSQDGGKPVRFRPFSLLATDHI